MLLRAVMAGFLPGRRHRLLSSLVQQMDGQEAWEDPSMGESLTLGLVGVKGLSCMNGAQEERQG